MNPWIQTYSNVPFDLKYPTKEQVKMEDIMHVLPTLWRYNNHTSRPYSVGEHLILVAHLARALAFEERGPVEDAFWDGIPHDVHETWYQDLTSPLKNLLGPGIQPLREALSRCDEAVYAFFDRSLPSRASASFVKRADYAILEWERVHFMGRCERKWVCEDDDEVQDILDIGRKHRVFPDAARHWDVSWWLNRYLDDLKNKRKIRLISWS